MKKNVAAFMFTALVAAGCGDNKPLQPDAADIDAPDIDAPTTLCRVTPGTWTAPDFATNGADALALRAQLDKLTGTMTMRGAETGAVVVDEVADLEAVYDAGTPVLSAKVHASANTVMDDAFADFVAAVTAGQQDLIDNTGWAPGANGGLFSTTRKAAFNIGAIELRQIVDKGLFGGGALYPYALGLTEGTITEATIDAMAAAWGTNPTLDSTVVTDSADYSFRMGFHAKVAKALTDAKAYASSADCTTERDAALVTFFRTWEQALFARVVFYANAGVSKLATATTDDQRADALHEFSEGLGLAIGFKGLPSPASGPLAGAGRTITDSDILAILSAVGVDSANLSASTTGTFVVDTGAFQTGVTAVENRVKLVYQLTDSDIVFYRTPTGG